VIYVSITEDYSSVAEISIEFWPTGNDELVTAEATITVDRGNSVGIYHKHVYDWPVKSMNYVGLLKAVLAQLDEDQIAIEEDDDRSASSATEAGSPAVAGGRPRALPAIQAGPSELRDHRPSIRSGQQVEHGSDGGGQKERP
jgi:hypothetical protein